MKMVGEVLSKIGVGFSENLSILNIVHCFLVFLCHDLKTTLLTFFILEDIMVWQAELQCT